MTELITAIASLAQVILIDLALSADNAVAVGVAAAALPEAQRGRAIRWGILFALVLRIAFGVVTLQLFQIPGLKAAGGILLFWIATRMWIDLRHSRVADAEAEARAAPAPKPFWRAMFSIVVATIALSLDNVIAVAAVASNVWIMAVGLVLSVLLMAVAATLIARVINRHRWIGVLGILVIIVAGVLMIWADAHHFRPDLVQAPPVWTGGLDAQ